MNCRPCATTVHGAGGRALGVGVKCGIIWKVSICVWWVAWLVGGHVGGVGSSARGTIRCEVWDTFEGSNGRMGSEAVTCAPGLLVVFQQMLLNLTGTTRPSGVMLGGNPTSPTAATSESAASSPHPRPAGQSLLPR